MINLTRTLIFFAGLTACGGGAAADCIYPPCALAIAVKLTITSAASGASVPGATVTVTGADSSQFACNGTCIVGGAVGTYNIQVDAPGFTSAQRSVHVTGTSPTCGCDELDTQDLTIALAASS